MQQTTSVNLLSPIAIATSATSAGAAFGSLASPAEHRLDLPRTTAAHRFVLCGAVAIASQVS